MSVEISFSFFCVGVLIYFVCYYLSSSFFPSIDKNEKSGNVILTAEIVRSYQIVKTHFTNLLFLKSIFFSFNFFPL